MCAVTQSRIRLAPALAMATVGAIGTVVASCTDSLPTAETVAGTYSAMVFTIQEGNGPVQDILAEGGSIQLVLNVEGTTTGHLFVSGAGEDGSDFDADLTGAWMLEAQTITLEHAADTFLRDMLFSVEGDRLRGQESFSGTVVTVTLSKQ